MTLGAGKPAQECESGKTVTGDPVTGDPSLRATGGFFLEPKPEIPVRLSGPFSPEGGVRLS